MWQASYAPFGQAQITKANLSNANLSPSSFTLNLRLPGQYEDSETGLFYNRQRYYDPSRGEYLSPDPLGTPDGPNGYAYVRYNPLKYVDPDGLVLFAFDGTGNSNDQATLDDLNNGRSNVWAFHELYTANKRYVSGVGTRHIETNPQFGGDIDHAWSSGDMGGNYTGPARIERMIAYFNAEAEQATDNNTAMDVDIIGFSRGAAQAREFANRIDAHTQNGLYRYTMTVNGVQQERCQRVNFRFMGLWDTVLSTNRSGTDYNLSIVPGFQHVAQAVALNEYRGDLLHAYGSIGAFPLESIMDGMASPVPTPGQVRIERGFLGSHADIGGGFRNQENALPLVALSWMVEQARTAGVNMLAPRASIGASAVLHDRSDSIQTGVPAANAEDRLVRYRNGSTTTQRQMPVPAGMSYADTQQNLISYLPPNDASRWLSAQDGQTFITGTVNMASYLQWLRAPSNGYNLGNLTVQ